MSRPDTHPSDFEYPPFDSRDFQIQPQPLGHSLRKYPYSPSPRDSARDSPRDFLSRESPNVPSGYYHSPSPLLGDGGRQVNTGYSAGMVSPPRMHNTMVAHSIGVMNNTPSDNWSVVTPSATPPNRQYIGGASLNAVPNSASQLQPNSVHSPLSLNHHHRASPPRSLLSPAQAAFNDRERDPSREVYYTNRHIQQQQSQQQQRYSNSPPNPSIPHAQPVSQQSPTSAASPRSTLWWGELEPWMDEEYAKQVCTLMGWDPINIKVPRPAPDPLTGRQANNPGYCFLTFPSTAHAASVLTQINGGPNSSGSNVVMPNSTRPFMVNWASSVPTAPLSTGFAGPTISIPGAQNPQYPKEYSIFVGDLAPEVSNSDLVAVFRNPVLGLRNDREPRFIRPFLSCKSAKIMLDPVTGVSRGYGFVRFTDEADQQRALIEMHGLYCLSRPMRISPATAKFKPAPGVMGLDFTQMGMHGMVAGVPAGSDQQVTVALPLPNTSQTKSVSTPLATTALPPPASGSGTSIVSGTGSVSVPSLSSNPSTTSSHTLASPSSEEAMVDASNVSNPNTSSVPSTASNNALPSNLSTGMAQPTQDQLMAQRYNIPEESWKHHAQARAILSNLIGPNGEQLTSSDPYNTTVFVGGLSPLISEETLRTFFAPFGEIHYVKVPVGKHCGFVQFVRKPDAEKAIEKMQGFPIGGSRIRLSWGRSQYKAAQAAAQAAQAAAVQAQYQVQIPSQNTSTLTAEQALQLLEKFGISSIIPDSNVNTQADMASVNLEGSSHSRTGNAEPSDLLRQYDNYGQASFDSRSSAQYGPSSFSPFSPDPNYIVDSIKGVNTASHSAQQFGFQGKQYLPWYASQDDKGPGSGKVSPPSTQARPSSTNQRFGPFLGGEPSTPPQASRASSRQEGPIARPDLSRRPSQIPVGQETYNASNEQEHDSNIQDLNGTLASLDLDHHQTSWKSGDRTSPIRP